MRWGVIPPHTLFFIFGVKMREVKQEIAEFLVDWYSLSPVDNNGYPKVRLMGIRKATKRMMRGFMVSRINNTECRYYITNSPDGKYGSIDPEKPVYVFMSVDGKLTRDPFTIDDLMAKDFYCIQYTVGLNGGVIC